jgi:Spy/CpxP family protein refolding chaperone
MRQITLNGLFLLAAFGTSACATHTVVTRPETVDEDGLQDQAAMGLRDHHRHQHRGGVLQFAAMSLDTLATDEARRPQVERIHSDLHACMAPTSGIHRRLLTAIADGVAAGAVDAQRIEPIIAELNAVAASIQTCGVESLNRLHALLSPEEREDLTEKVRAHWEVWRQVNDEEQAGARGPGGRLAVLTQDLSLSPDQVDRISAALHLALTGRGGSYDRQKAGADVQRFNEAFVRASFDGRAVVGVESTRLAGHGAERMSVFYGTVTPLLTPGQQAVLAGQLRNRADHNPAVSSN